MAIPPRHFLPEHSDEPLTENRFVVSGYSMTAGRYRVFDVETGRRCHYWIDFDTREEIASQWAAQGPPYPPGAVQYHSTVTISFSPAEPGKQYRLECLAGNMIRRYEGPPVALDPKMHAPEEPPPPEAPDAPPGRGPWVAVALAVVGAAAWWFLG